MKKKQSLSSLKWISFATCFLFIVTTVLPAELLASSSAQQTVDFYSVPGQPSIPSINPNEVSEDINEATSKIGYDATLASEIVLSAVTAQDKENSAYEYERYEFEDALELLRPEFASAVIVKSLTRKNLEKLLELDIETGIAVLHGEIVLFTTGNDQEIGILAPARKLIESASFMAHTHVKEGGQEGPSFFDLENAVGPSSSLRGGVASEAIPALSDDNRLDTEIAAVASLPRNNSYTATIEYVVTKTQAFSYFRNATPDEIQVYSHDEFIHELYEVKHDSPKIDQVAARAELNEFIKEMDLYNTALAEEREVFRKASTPLLDSITVEINSGATHTNNPNITLGLTVGEAIPDGEVLEMAFSEDGINFSSFEAFANSKNFALTGEDGEKTIFVKVKDSSDNERIIQTQIILDRTPPTRRFIHVDEEIVFESNDDGFKFGPKVMGIGNDLIAVRDNYESRITSQRYGMVKIYDKTGKKKLLISNPDSSSYLEFGKGMQAIGDNRLAVSAFGKSGTSSAIFIYDLDESSSDFGKLIKRIDDPDPSQDRDGFGDFMASENGFLVVGAHKNEVTREGGGVGVLGKSYVFDVRNTEATYGDLLAELVPPEPIHDVNSGQSFTFIESNGFKVVVGASGAAYVFDLNEELGNFGKHVQSIYLPGSSNPSDGNSSYFGRSVAASEGILFIGASRYAATHVQPSVGRVYAFDLRPGDDYGKLLKIIDHPSPTRNAYFGKTLVVHKDRLLVGAPGQESFIANVKGSVRSFDVNLFRNSFGDPLEVIQGEEYFGEDLALLEDSLLVGTFDRKSYGDKSVNLFSVIEDDYAIKSSIGEKHVKQREIKLQLDLIDSFTDTSELEIAISFDKNNFPPFQAYQSEMDVTLPSGPDGERKVFVRVKDEAGNIAILEKVFILDTTPPGPVGPGPVVTLNGGAEFANVNTPIYSIHPNIQDNFTDSSEILMGFSWDGENFPEFSFVPYSDSYEANAIFFANFFGDGLEERYVKFRDLAGNESIGFLDTIIYDSSDPVGSIKVNNNASSTDDIKVNLTLTASDSTSGVDQVRFGVFSSGITGGVVWFEWEDFKSTRSFDLLPVATEQRVYMEIRDKAGNTRVVSDGIQLTKAPVQDGPLQFNGAGLYELTLDQAWKDYLAKNMPASLASRLTAGEKLSVEAHLLKEYTRQYMADVYDFIFFVPTTRVFKSQLPTFGANFHETVLGLGWAELNNIEGIGFQELTDAQKAKFAPFEDLIREQLGAFMTELRESGRHQGTGLLDTQSIRNQEIDEDEYLDYVLLHELHHRWGSFLSSGGDANSNPLGILGRDHAHWDPFFDGEFSPLDAFNWRDNGDGTFTMTHYQGMSWQHILDFALGRRSDIPVTSRYNDFDLYAMGFLGKENVQSSFMIDNPRTLDNRALNGETFLQFILDNPSFILGNRTIKGTRRNVTIQDVIDIEGERDPLAADSQKDFNIAFIYVKDEADGSTNNDQKQTAARWQDTIGSIWNAATRGLSTMSAGFTSAAFEAFKTNVLDLFDEQAGVTGEGDPAEITRGNDLITLLGDLDAVVQQIDNLLAPLIERAKHGGLVVRFVENITAPLDLLKAQLAQFRSTLEDALANAKNNNIVEDKRNEVLSLVAQSAVTGLLPAGFGSSVDAIIQLVKNIFTDLKLANDDFAGSSSSIEEALNALLAKVKGPILGHSFDVVGDVKVDGTDFVFGDSSGRFDGVGDSLRLEDSENWAVGTGDFTIDFRFKFNSLDSIQTLFSMNGASDIVVAKDGANRLLVMIGGQVITQTAWPVKVGEWSHFALTRDNGIVRVFINGVQFGPAVSAPHNITKTSSIDIGRWTGSARFFNGWLDEFRISDGITRWAANFTPPTEEYSRDGITSFLLHFTPEEFAASAEVDDADPATEPPEGTININAGAAGTNSLDVTLNLSATDNITETSNLEMAISVDGGNTFSAFESFAATKNVTLPAGGSVVKTVVVRYRDEDGNTADFSDTITLDQTAPTGSVVIENGAIYTQSIVLPVSLSVSDAVSANSDIEVAVSYDGGVNFFGFEKFTPTKNIPLPLPVEDGVKTIVIRYRDEAGNTRDVSDTIIFDTTPPISARIVINGDAEITKSLDVTLTLTAVDEFSDSSEIEMGFSFDDGNTYSDYESFKSSKNVTLPPGNFTQVVIVRYRDAAGNVTHTTDFIKVQVPEPPYVPKKFTVNGNTQAFNDNSAFDKTAGRFDGAGDYLSLENHADWAIGTGDFTVDFRAKFNSLASIQTFFSMNGASDIVISKDGANRLLVMIGGQVITQTAWPFKTNEWMHIALVRENGLARVFVNGVQLGAAVSSSHNISKTGTVDIGKWTGSSRFLNGFVDELRISKVAKWTSRFTPPSSEFQRDGDTIFLLHFTEDEFNQEAETKAVDPTTVPPEGTVSIAGGAPVTTTLETTLNLSVTDNLTAEGGIEVAISLDGGANFGAFESFSALKNITFPVGNGTKTVVVRYRDEDGNTFDATDTITLNYTDPATIAPTGTVSINGGSAVTLSPDVVLSLGVVDNLTAELDIDMAISVDDGNTFGAFESFSRSKNVTLPLGNGTKTVVVRYRDLDGNTVDVSDTITLDFKDPSKQPPVGSVSINDGADPVGSENVTLTLSVTDNLTAESNIEMAISVDNGATFGAFESFASTKNVTLPGESGTKVVVVRYRDEDGNTADFSDIVTLDKLAPRGSVSIEGGAGHTTSAAVTLTLDVIDFGSVTEALQMAISVDGGTTFSSFESFATSKNVTLPSGDGTKTVIVRYRDEVGNTADFSDTIILDGTPPTGSVSINAGGASTETTQVNLNLTVNDAISENSAIQMAISVDGGATFSAFESFQAVKSVNLPSGNGAKQVVVRYRDEAGNTVDVSDSISLQIPLPPFTPKTFTVHGNARAVNDNSAYDEAAGFLDGAGNYISLQNHPDWAFGTGDFTIDFRAKFNDLSSIQTLFSMNGANDIAIAKDGANRLLVMMGGQVITQTAANFRKDTWMHFAVTRSNGQVRVFVNGVQVGTTMTSNLNITRQGPAHIGQWTNGARGFNGTFDEFQISKVARWISNFTPPSEKQTRDDDTSLLLRFTEEEFTAGAEVDDADPSTIAPEGTIAINNGAAGTGSPDVTLSLSVTDNLTAESNIEMAISVDGGVTFGAFEAFSSSKNVTLPSGSGTKTVVVKYRDADGNTANFSDTIVLDETPPTGSIKINGDAKYTNQTTVALTLTANDAVSPTSALQMAFSFDEGANYSSYENFATSKNVILPSAEGIRRILVRYKDEAGNVREADDVIILDQTPPSGSVLINGTAVTTTKRDVTLTMNVSSDTVSFAVSVDGGTTFSAFENRDSNFKDVTLPSGNGIKTVVVRYRDEAGNTRDVSDTINLDEPKPLFTPKNYSVNGNASIDTSQSVFGGSSVRFDGLGDYLQLEESEGWPAEINDFTIDFRARFNNLASIQTFFSINGANDIAIAKDGANRILVMMGGQVMTQTAWPFKKDEWMHVAVTRENGFVRVFINGTQIGAPKRYTRSISPNNVVHIGQWTNGARGFNGWMDELYISTSKAKWTSNFTPPTNEYTRDDDTDFLLHFTNAEFTAGAEV